MKDLLSFLFFVAFVVAHCDFECQHGSCHNGVCACDTYYKGNDCSIYSRPIREGEIINGQVKENEWRYYPMHTTDTETITWTVNANSNQAFCALYINFNDYPSESNYLYKNSSGKKEETVDVLGAPVGKWIAGVWGITACSYTIHVDFSPPCDPPCGKHGQL